MTEHGQQERERTIVGGYVASGFEAVRDAFQANFDRHGDLGAACAVYRDGELLVDLWGGVTGVDGGRSYGEDTLQLIFSSTKGAVAICANLLIERGQLDPSAPVVEYWPEFGAAGKADIPVEWLLTHKAGLAAIDAVLPLEDFLAWDPVIAALQEQAPLWEPGTAQGYHAVTFGYLVGEVVRRISGRSVGRFFAEEVAEPLGLEFWIGLPETEEHRVAPLTLSLDYLADMDPEQLAMMAVQFGPDGLGTKALFMNGAFGTFSEEGSPFNERAVHAAEIPAANGITTARSLARLYAAVIGEVGGLRLLAPDTVGTMRRPRTQGADLVLGGETRFGLGIMADCEFTPFLGPASFGHYGAGGSVGFADPESGIAFAYVMNQMRLDLNGDVRTASLVDAVRASLS